MKRALKIFLIVWGIAILFTLTRGEAFADIFLAEKLFLAGAISSPIAMVGEVAFWKYYIMCVVLLWLILVVLAVLLSKLCLRKRLKKTKRNLMGKSKQRTPAAVFVGKQSNKKVVTSEPSKFKRVVPKK